MGAGGRPCRCVFDEQKLKVDHILNMGKKNIDVPADSINLCLGWSSLCAKYHFGCLIEHKRYHWEIKCTVGCEEACREPQEHH